MLTAGIFRWVCEELYRKRTGEYFLYGEGGPMSKYSRQVEQNGWAEGEKKSFRCLKTRRWSGQKKT
jgi:hypothetical protein